CLFMYGVFLAVRLWGRRGAAAFLAGNVFAAPFLAAPFLLVLLTGLRCALVFLSVCAAVLAGFVLMGAVEERENRRYAFVPVKIRPARMVPFLTGRARLCMAFCAAAVLCISLRTAAGITSAPSVGGIQLPSAGGGGGDFPNMNDFISWKWEVMTFPYRSVNEGSRRGAPANGETVFFPRYADAGGLIEESVQSISFDSEFRRAALEAVDSLQYPPIEKLLKAQGLSFRAGYASTGVQRVTALTAVLLAVSFLIPSVLCAVAARRCR
ncbi:MAG: hypothetical protein K2H09_05850, partial [Treponemataceae bacterium]|nr:hypothetical protein [Treponemataceae bacterium]